MKPVRIEQNADGTYSAYIYSTCICRGAYDECVRAVEAHGERI
jgi:hypothetical protein